MNFGSAVMADTVSLRVVKCLLLGGLLFVLSSRGSAGQWVEAPGTGWAKFEVSHHDTRERFDETGTVESFFNKDARAITSTVRFTGALGLVQGLDLWVDVPAHRLAFNDVTRDRLSAGIGDPRVFLRAGPSLFGIDEIPVAVALRGGTKFPVGDFEVDAEVIPLSEGQRDWELLLEMGRSLHPWPAYVMAWAGYRWRTVNAEIGRKPGDERIFYVAAGGSVQSFQWKLAADALFGRPPLRTDFNLRLGRDRRSLVQVMPTVGWTLGPGAVELGARVPVHGRNHPAGPVFTIGYFLSWDSPVWK